MSDDELPASKTCEYVECGRVFERGNRSKYRWRHTRFCTPDCARRGTNGGPSRRSMCGKDKHAMTGNNVRIDPRTGKRSCQGCQNDRNAAARAAEKTDAAAAPLVGPGWEPTAGPWRPPWPDQGPR